MFLLAGYNVELIVKKDHVLEMMNLVTAQLTGAVCVCVCVCCYLESLLVFNVVAVYRSHA